MRLTLKQDEVELEAADKAVAEAPVDAADEAADAAADKAEALLLSAAFSALHLTGSLGALFMLTSG